MVPVNKGSLLVIDTSPSLELLLEPLKHFYIMLQLLQKYLEKKFCNWPT